MKFGQQLQSESVPQWSIHNIDYNTLKEFIKVHTTRDQASAIVIPGQKDTALHQFEAEFYDELCRQHDRVGLFVATKADEIGRRLQHVADQVHRCLLRNNTAAAACGTAALKRQRRFAKYERAVVQLREEVQYLRRFVQAQVVAFRKILKKYRKWTGSSTLGARFRDNVLSDPKSFTRRDFADLESQCADLINTLYAATPLSSSAASELSDTNGNGSVRQARLAAGGQAYSSSTSTLQGLSSSAGSATQQQQQQQQHEQQTPTQQTPSPARRSPPRRSKTARTPRRVTLLATAPLQTHYWNEYDDGSENGDEGRRPGGGGSGGYALYLHPDDDEADFPGMATLVSFFTVPLEKAKKWMATRGGSSRRRGRGEGEGQDGGGAGGDGGTYDPLLARRGRGGGYGATAAVAAAVDAARRFSVEEGYARDDEDERDNARDVDVDGDDDDDAFASDDDDAHRLLFPRRGYVTHYAAATLPPIEAQRLARYRDALLLRGLLGCDAAALVVLGVAAVLVATGRHKMRVEVDAGVITGVVASLGFACAALGLWMARTAAPSLAGRLAVWLSFAVVCVLNGAVLVLVMDNTVVPLV